MRILYVIPELSVGGTERQLLILARATQERGHAVRLLALHPARRPASGADGLDILTLDTARPHDPRCVPRLFREVRAFRPDVLHTFLFGFDLWANTAARLSGVPCVVSSRRELAAWQTRRHRAWQSLGNLLADAVAANSVAAAEYACATERFLDRGSVYRIANAFAPQAAAGPPDELPPRHGPVLLYVANFWPEKNHELLVRAFARLRAERAATLWLVGEGDRLTAAQSLARTLDVATDVHFLGRRHDIAALLAGADLYVHASRRESSPNAVLEAMGAGVPVVAAACGGVPELLGGGALGTLCAPDSEDELVAAARFALDHPDGVRAAAAAAAVCVRERHASSALAERHLALYRAVARRALPDAPGADGGPNRLSRLGVYAIGNRGVPSTWFRIMQMVPFLQDAGYRVRVFELPPTAGGRLRQFLGLLRQGAVRCRQLRRARDFDAVLIQKGLSPARWRGLLPRLLAAGRRFVFDIDDAVHRALPIRLPAPLRRLQRDDEPRELMRRAAVVTAGNAWLADEARAFTRSVAVVPTAVDTDRYWFSPVRPAGTPVIGWSGSASTNPCVNLVLPVLARLATRHAFVFQVMSDSLRGIDRTLAAGVDLRFVPWSRETEISVIRGFSIGIMPLPDTPWERGKCGLKVLLYMALGVAPVCSPVGVNAQIVRDGVNGYVAADSAQWESTLEKLLDDPGLRARLGREARQTVAERYSVVVSAGVLCDALAVSQEQVTQA